MPQYSLYVDVRFSRMQYLTCGNVSFPTGHTPLLPRPSLSFTLLLTFVVFVLMLVDFFNFSTTSVTTSRRGTHHEHKLQYSLRSVFRVSYDLCLALSHSLRPRRSVRNAMAHEINMYGIVQKDVRSLNNRTLAPIHTHTQGLHSNIRGPTTR